MIKQTLAALLLTTSVASATEPFVNELSDIRNSILAEKNEAWANGDIRAGVHFQAEIDELDQLIKEHKPDPKKQIANGTLDPFNQ